MCCCCCTQVIFSSPIRLGHLTTPSNQNWMDNLPHQMDNLPWRWIFCPKIYTCKNFFLNLWIILNLLYAEMWRNLNNGPDAGNGFSCQGQVIFFIYFITTALGPFRSLMGHNIIRWYLYSRLPIFDHFLPLDGPY